MRPHRLLISFSGVDGSGKSTQLEHLRATLDRLGYRTRVLAFWDDVVVGTGWREGFVHKVYGSERGVGAPGKPVRRRDKNVRKWYLTAARHALYLLDAIHLAWVVRRARGKTEALIFDRYIYDELANLPLQSAASQAFARTMAAIVPRPDVAFLLDADVEAAHARKPEYPLEFMHRCRAAYLNLASELGTMTIIPPLPLEAAKAALVEAFQRKIGSAAEPGAHNRTVPAA